MSDVRKETGLNPAGIVQSEARLWVDGHDGGSEAVWAQLDFKKYAHISMLTVSTLIYIYIYMYVYTYIYVCVCMYANNN